MIGSDGEGERKEAIRVKDARSRQAENGSIGKEVRHRRGMNQK